MSICLNWRLFLEENSIRAVIVGIPGVGKTTVISEVQSILQKRGMNAETAVFGTLMFEQANKKGLKNRDEIRNLSITDQRNLQEDAAKKISGMRARVIIIDTHLFIKTSEWYYPGIPLNVSQIISPTHLLLIIADAGEIRLRRQADTTRHRDLPSKEDIQREIDLSMMMIVSLANLTGSPFTMIENNNNQAEKAAQDIARILVGNICS
jgi:adenylate kinase